MEGLLHASQLYSLFISKISCRYHKCSTWGKQHSHFIEDSDIQESENFAQNYTDHQWRCSDSIPEPTGSRIHALDHIAARELGKQKGFSAIHPLPGLVLPKPNLDRIPALLSLPQSTEGRGCGYEFALLRSLNCIRSIVEKAFSLITESGTLATLVILISPGKLQVYS